MNKTFLSLVISFLCLGTMQGQITYESTQAKANRFFQHKEWASAAAMYNFMLQEHPTSSDTYGRAIVATEMIGDSLRSQELFLDAMKYGVPLDSILNNVRRYSFLQSRSDMYEQFMLNAIKHNPWMERPIDAYLLRYYTFKRDGIKMIVYADKLLRGTPGNIQFLQTKAEGCMINNQPEEAIATWKQILKIQPDNYLALLNLANYYDITKNSQEALSYFQQAKRVKATPYVDEAIHRLSYHK